MFNWLFKKVVTFREKVAVDLGEGDTEKPFLDHLEDLRTMIVRIVTTLLVVTIVTFIFIKELMLVITYPLVLAGISDAVTLQNFKPTGGFMTAMNISIVAGLIISFPVLLYFLLQFVLPGLRSNEKKVLFPALGVGGGLFLVGVVFAYFVVTPRALTFFYEFSRDIGNMGHVKVEQQVAVPGAGSTTVLPDLKPGTRITAATADGKLLVFEVVEVRTPAAEPGKEGTTQAPAPGPNAEGKPGTASATDSKLHAPFLWDLTEYVKFICQFILIFGACFELPVVVMALVKLDVLNYKVMKTSRAWAAIIICIVAAVITPTQDAMTLSLLAVPMYLLYEICIWLAWWLEKRDRALYPEYYKDRDEDEKELEVTDDWDNENYNPWGGDDQEEENEEDDASSSKPKPAAAPADAPKPDAEGAAPPSSVTTNGEGDVSDSSYSPPESNISGDSSTETQTESESQPGPHKDEADSSEESEDWSLKKDKPDDDPTADKRDTD